MFAYSYVAIGYSCCSKSSEAAPSTLHLLMLRKLQDPADMAHRGAAGKHTRCGEVILNAG